MTQTPLFFTRMSLRADGVIAGLVVMSGITVAQAQNSPTPASQPPAKSTAPVETDIGRVTPTQVKVKMPGRLLPHQRPRSFSG
jgi:hypothetical protein